VRRRYDFLFGLILNAGLRITEALQVRSGTCGWRMGLPGSMHVIIGKGNRERLVPLPKNFGQVFKFWLSDRGKDNFVLRRSRAARPRAHAVLPPPATRARGLDKKVTPHKLRHTYATRLLEAGAELVNIQALLGHVNWRPPQIYTHVSEGRMAGVVAKL
jgi:integrase/recombinase XerD